MDNLLRENRQKVVTAGTITDIARQAIELAEQEPLEGVEKKQLVVGVIHAIIQNSRLSASEKETLTVIINLFLPNLIDNIVFAFKSTFDTNRDGEITLDEITGMCCM